MVPSSLSAQSVFYDVDVFFLVISLLLGAAYIHIVDYSNVTNPVILKNVAIFGNGEINDIEMCGDKVAFAVQGATNTQPGQIHVYNLYDNETGNFQMLYSPLIGMAVFFIKNVCGCGVWGVGVCGGCKWKVCLWKMTRD